MSALTPGLAALLDTTIERHQQDRRLNGAWGDFGFDMPKAPEVDGQLELPFPKDGGA